ncbi:helix-turn-helix transcriptional regulator [Pedobacter sp. ASV1-7]|uniref:helix-turn-helix domain-containing protein n=1 Tax=Pedobacter sp. ASV1-7 TaxID=3145237 RepID=UPI0032E8FAE6
MFLFFDMVMDFGEMHPLTAVIIVLELMMLSVQLYFYLIWPYHRSRFTYLVLLVLLIFYNLAGGFFPDRDIGWLSLSAQNIIAHGMAFLMAAYFPYYFYISFDLSPLRFHALYGAPIFLLLPFLFFFVFLHILHGDLDYAISYGVLIPGLYSLVLMVVIFRAISFRVSSKESQPDDFTCLEMQAVYWAVFPWGFMPFFIYLQMDQWGRVLFANIGFVVIAVLFLFQSGKYERKQRRHREEREAMEEKQRADFNQTCLQMGLSLREAEVALMLCQGFEYKVIGDLLHISARTVDTHAHRIYYKLEVRNKIELQQVLGFSN